MKNIYQNIKIWIKNLLKSITVFKIVAIIVIIYFSILIYKEVKPETFKEQVMHCLELGSDARATACISLLKK